MSNLYKISALHIILISLTSIGLKNHVMVISPILEVAKRDGWMSVLLAGIFLFPWILWIIYIQRKSELKPMKLWLTEKIGKAGANIILYSFVVFCFFLAAFTLIETILWMSSTFLENTPIPFLLIVYIVVCFLLVSTNIQTIVSVNTIILFFVIVFGIYVAITNIQVKNHELLFPLLEHGFRPVVNAMIYPASGFIELYLLLFLQHYLKKPLKWYHLGIILFCFIGLTMGPLIGAIVEFGPEEAAKQNFPAYEEWTLVSIGRFIEHMDFLSVYQWLSGTFIRVGIILFIVCDILNFTGQPKKIWLYLMPPFLILNFALVLVQDENFLIWSKYYFLDITFIFIFLLSIVLILIAMLKQPSFQRLNRKQNMNESSE